MTEPTTTAAAVGAVPLIVVFSSVFGVNLGPYVLITIGAICGSFWALASAESLTRWAAVRLSARVILLSVLMTTAVAELLAHAFDWHLSELYIIVSVGIAAMGDKWLEVINSLKEAIMSGMANIFKKKDAS